MFSMHQIEAVRMALDKAGTDGLTIPEIIAATKIEPGAAVNAIHWLCDHDIAIPTGQLRRSRLGGGDKYHGKIFALRHLFPEYTA